MIGGYWSSTHPGSPQFPISWRDDRANSIHGCAQNGPSLGAQDMSGEGNEHSRYL